MLTAAMKIANQMPNSPPLMRLNAAMTPLMMAMVPMMSSMIHANTTQPAPSFSSVPPPCRSTA